MAAAAVSREHLAVAPSRLAPPPRRPGLVERPALLARLDAASAQQLTVLRAPTGYGKTTLLARWAATLERPLAWVTLSWAEREPSRFWAVVEEALRRAAGRDLVLVLDDYDAIVHSPAEVAFDRFLDAAPETLHVVVASRSEPRLRLALRRASGSVSELVDDDLGFSEVEVAEVLRLTAAVRLRRPELELVAWRTEGWPAGVHLAALAAAAAERPEEAAVAFTGASRDVADYLGQELLDALPDDEHRSFLLRTAVLDQLTPPLCDALLRRGGSQTLLRDLVASGAFLKRVDEEGTVFRHRRMAREFLLGELERVADLSALHRRAAVACERAGRIDEAVAHARAAGDERSAGAIARRHALELARAGRAGALEPLLAATGSGQRKDDLSALARRVAAAGGDVPELLAASGRLAAASERLPRGPVVDLVRITAVAARATGLLLANRLEEAAAEADAAAAAATSPSAAQAQLAAVASLAAALLGRPAAAAPQARAAEAAVRASGARGGEAAALTAAAEGVVLAAHGDDDEADAAFAAAAAADEPGARALALALLARTRAAHDARGARAALARARAACVAVPGAELPAVLVASAAAELSSRERRPPDTRELSHAELRVLRLLGSRLTQREIARELYVSPNTVKTHARVIYRKLGVASRSAAVRTARELNLV